MRYIFILTLLLLPNVLNAMTLEVQLDPSLSVGDTALVPVSLFTEGEIINAVEGTISIPSQLRVREIRFSGSVIPVWLERPYETESGVYEYAAVIPGGYQNGSYEQSHVGNMFTLIVEAVAPGTGRIELGSETRAYLNDGEGTIRELSLMDASIDVGEATRAALTADVPMDTFAPEDFTLSIVSGELFGMEGRVLTFSAHDKDSGIAGYDVARSFFPLPEVLLSFSEVQSPAALSFLDSFRIITVRARDVQGNSHAEHITPGGVLGYVPTLTLVILILLVWHIYLRPLRATIKK